MTTLLLLLFGLVAALLGSGLMYGLGSYAFARPHHAPRPLGVAARELLREAGWAVFLTPLLPLFYLLGRRMGAGPGTVPVVLVHGYTQTRADFLRLGRRLARTSSAGPLFGFNYQWAKSIDASAADLTRFVSSVCARTGASQVDLVCHSQGGLVARAMLAAGGAASVRRLVTLGTPHAGVAWKGPLLGESGQQMRQGSPFLTALAAHPLTVPTLSIYSTHDNIVYPPQTSSLAALGGTDDPVDGYGHLALLFVPGVLDRVARFLER